MLATSACGTLGGLVTGGPATVADQTKVDEQLGLSLTLAYTAASRAAALAISTGLVRDVNTIRKIGALDTRAYNAVVAVHNAYLAANGTNYLASIAAARAAISDLLVAAKGSSAMRQLVPPAPLLTLPASYTEARAAHYRLLAITGGARA